MCLAEISGKHDLFVLVHCLWSLTSKEKQTPTTELTRRGKSDRNGGCNELEPESEAEADTSDEAIQAAANENGDRALTSDSGAHVIVVS